MHFTYPGQTTPHHTTHVYAPARTILPFHRRKVISSYHWVYLRCRNYLIILRNKRITESSPFTWSGSFLPSKCKPLASCSFSNSESARHRRSPRAPSMSASSGTTFGLASPQALLQSHQHCHCIFGVQPNDTFYWNTWTS